jgi:mannitol-1-phosphate 5-dehydrogenase
MVESGNGLITKHGFKPEAHWAYVETSLGRYRNPYLKDVLVRVGREPYRKLSATDRLVGPMMNARRYGFTVENLIKGIAAGLHYSYVGDPQSIEMQQKIAEKGVLETAKELLTPVEIDEEQTEDGVSEEEA